MVGLSLKASAASWRRTGLTSDEEDGASVEVRGRNRRLAAGAVSPSAVSGWLVLTSGFGAEFL